jgi:hypothetical protein
MALVIHEHVGSLRTVLANPAGLDRVHWWRVRTVALYDRLGDRFPRDRSRRPCCVSRISSMRHRAVIGSVGQSHA